MFTALLVLIGAVFVVYILPQFSPFHIDLALPMPPEPPHNIIRLFDGPNDGQVHEVRVAQDQLPHFFVAPYLPLDEDGNPAPDESNIVQQANGMVFVKPSLAYYQQVTEQDYFYVRDITDNEFNQIKYHGQLPTFKLPE